MTKNYKKGITLVELVVVIIILVLLAVIAMYNTNKPLQEAEALTVISEFRTVYQAVSNIKDNYNAGHDLVEGEDYCEEVRRDDGSWYALYGLQDYSEDPRRNKYDEAMLSKYLGIPELKRSYEYRINPKYSSSDVEVRYFDGRSVKVNGFKVKTYEDLQNVRGEITK